MKNYQKILWRYLIVLGVLIVLNNLYLPFNLPEYQEDARRDFRNETLFATQHHMQRAVHPPRNGTHPVKYTHRSHGNATAHWQTCQKNFNTYEFPPNGCIVNAQSQRPHCQFHQLVVDPSKITSRGVPGAKLETVMGQAEEDEFLTYYPGAFLTDKSVDPPIDQRGARQYRHLDALKTLQVVDTLPECSQILPGLTLLLTRYEYVNLYHTMTDWWNSFSSIPSSDHDSKVNVLFLDAHPQGSLDPVWTELFDSVQYIRELKGTTCLEQARFVPVGYTCPLFPGIASATRTCPEPSHMKAFSDFVLERYGLLDTVKRVPGRVVVLDRVPYVAHARSNPNATQRTLGNLAQLAQDLPKEIDGSVDVRIATLVHDSFLDQLKIIREASVLIANHGAGLTHMAFLDSGAQVVELSCGMGFFTDMAKWKKDITHHCLPRVEDHISKTFWATHIVPIVQKSVALG